MRISNPIVENSIFVKRLLLAAVIMIIGVVIILFRIFDLQIIKHDYYKEEAIENQLLIRSIAPIRGRIFDRNGVLLADNKLAYTLTITPEVVPDINQMLASLKTAGFVDDNHIESYRENRKHYKAFHNIVLRENIPEELSAKLLVSQNFKGVSIKPYFKRIYPKKNALTHVIGYVSRISATDKKKYTGEEYKGISHIGKIGIEKKYDHLLNGRAGLEHIIRDASGKVINIDITKFAQAGADIYLSVDYELQELAQSLLANKRGAIVLMDVKTAEVLALVSAPSFDANLFIGGISRKNYKALKDDKNLPLFNRALQGVYPPGSTIKPFVALAGLENNVIHKEHTVFCTGSYSLPNNTHQYKDWKKAGHGNIDLENAISQSCDVFFYDLAYHLGINKIHNYLTQFNFGRPTGIDMPNEASGILPSRMWKKKNKGEPWYAGETVIAGIGQGFVSSTPIQLAFSIAILANHGKYTKPKLVRHIQEIGGKVIDKKAQFHSVPIKNIKNWEAVLTGMKQTIYHPKGTARHLNKNLTYTLAGKTGTAQVFGLGEKEKYVAAEIPERLRDHALFTAFAPIENPEIAIAVIVENAGSGSANAAPLARKLLDAYFAKNNKVQ